MSQSDPSPETPMGGSPSAGGVSNNPASETSIAPECEGMQGPPGSPASSGVLQRVGRRLPLPGFVKTYLASWPGRTLPLPGFAKIYLVLLYILLVAIAVMLIGRLGHTSDVGAVLLTVLVGVEPLVFMGILRIHERSPWAPSFARGLMIFIGVLLVGLYLFFVWLLYVFYSRKWGFVWPISPQETAAALLFPLYAAAWYLYWKRSPRVREVFRETRSTAVDTSPAGLQLSRFAAMSVCLVGIGYFVGSFRMDSRYFPWISLCFLAVWVLLGWRMFLLAAPATFRAERSFSALLAGTLVLWLFNLAHTLIMTGIFGKSLVWTLTYDLALEEYISTAMICMLCYAGWRALQAKNAPEKLTGLLGGIRDGLRSGVSYIELGGFLTVAYYLFNELPLYARAGDVPELIRAFAEGSFPQVSLSCFSYVLTVACASVVVFGGLAVLLKAPTRLTGLLRVFVPAMLAGYAVFTFSPLREAIAEQGFTAPMAIDLERWYIHLPLVLGMLTWYVWRRKAVLGAGRPAPVAMIRAVSWYFVIKLVFFLLVFAINPPVPPESGYLLSGFEGYTFRVVWLFARQDWMLAILGAGMLACTARPATASLSRLMGWGIAFIAVAVLGDLALKGISALFAGHFWAFIIHHMESRWFGTPWLQPLPVGFAVFLLMCSSWDRARSWFAGSR